jgi:putative alpha-1,2-mannosidase
MNRLAFFLILAFSFHVFAQTKDPARFVNPFIGTGGHGHTFPGATMPFGMVQLSPDTRIDNWDGSSGYHYSDDIIYGFSHTHLSGTGIPDGCDILLMPTTGEPGFFKSVEGGAGPEWYISPFSHSNERAEPGYYSVKLDKWDVLAELTSTTRVGLHRYKFQQGGTGNIVLDLLWRDKRLDSKITTPTSTRVEGFRRSMSWAKDQTVYFVAEFSKPYERDVVQGRVPDVSTANYQRVFKFSVKTGEQILVKVAISYVSIEGARKNLEAELPHWDFDRVRADAKATWNKELSKIEVSGGTPDQTTTFYTALYHTMIHPNVFNDVDGRYKGHDGKIHSIRSGDTPVPDEGRLGPKKPNPPTKARSLSPEEPAIGDKSVPAPSEHYTVFSLWDTFRAAHPLYTIIDQKRTVDFINTFIRIYEQGGRLPVWELWGEETDTMIGYHAVSVIADAMAKGIKGFDYEKAYAAAKHSAELDHFGLAAYKKRGYISGEDDNESVSKTLEYAYNDWCLSAMALLLADRAQREHASIAKTREYLKDADEFYKRAHFFENLFDPETSFFRPKRNGGFLEPFAPNEVTFHFTEGNSWQYSFFVPHDVMRLIELMGGREKFAAKLDELFTTGQKLTGRDQPDITGLIGQYAHGNEPSHHIPYLYNYAGKPSRTQRLVRKIMDEFYKNSPDGLIGNEDCGQMSAWYVLSAAGLYSVAPGNPKYEIGTPLFKEVKFDLENGKTFTVRAPYVSQQNIYIQSTKLNGKPHTYPFITHMQIISGGVLEFEMDSRPNDDAFEKNSNLLTGDRFTAVPLVNGERVFKDNTTITVKATQPNTRITYATGNFGEESARKTQTYTGPFTISETTKVIASATDLKTGVESMKVEAVFSKRANDWTVKLLSTYNSQYPGGGDDAVIDGLRGNANFAAGEWQGFWGKPFEAVIDLQRETEIKSVGGSFLQTARSWIWMPANIEFQISDNGTDFRTVASIKTDIPLTEMNPTIKEFRQSITPTRARYVRIRAFNIGKIPEWHPGRGLDPWIFVDEIFVN